MFLKFDSNSVNPVLLSADEAIPDRMEYTQVEGHEKHSLDMLLPFALSCMRQPLPELWEGK